MKKWNALDWVTFVLVFIGGINWGLIGFFHFNLVGVIFGHTSMISRVIFGLVGLASLYQLVSICKSGCCKADHHH